MIGRSGAGPGLQARDERVPVVDFTEEGATRRLLSDYFDTIAVPLSDERRGGSRGAACVAAAATDALRCQATVALGVADGG